MQLPSLSILLADDDLDDQELLKEAFLSINPNLSLHSVSCGPELLAFLKECPEGEWPCLLVLDYNMPGMSGLCILDQLNSDPLYRDIPAVVWSTSNSPLLKMQSEAKDAKIFFQKPMSYEELIPIAAEMLTYCKVSSVSGMK